MSDLNAYVRSKGKKSGTVPSLLLFTDPTLAGLLDKLYTAETQAASLQNITGEKNDAIDTCANER